MANLSSRKSAYGYEWAFRHNQAVTSAEATLIGYDRNFESVLVSMLRGWQFYARQYEARYGFSIGDDGVLGPQWAAIGESLLALLNGELGRLDGGTLGAFIRDTMRENGGD